MSAPSPSPLSRPRIVNVAFWCWLAAAILLIAGGLLTATVDLPGLPGVFRAIGVLSAVVGVAIALLAGKTRTRDPRFRRAALSLSLATVVVIALIQMSTGYGLQPVVPGVFLVLVTGFLSIQIKAARIHTSVELTPEYLRQGTETIRLSEIVKIFPEAGGAETQKWESARALGELAGVPRGRKGIGLKLTGGRMAQAWARKHRYKQLREALTAAVD